MKELLVEVATRYRAFSLTLAVRLLSMQAVHKGPVFTKATIRVGPAVSTVRLLAAAVIKAELTAKRTE